MLTKERIPYDTLALYIKADKANSCSQAINTLTTNRCSNPGHRVLHHVSSASLLPMLIHPFQNTKMALDMEIARFIIA